MAAANEAGERERGSSHPVVGENGRCPNPALAEEEEAKDEASADGGTGGTDVREGEEE